MATTDKKIVEELKSETNGRNRSSNKNKESAKQGANKIAEFVNDISDKASTRLADAVMAAIVQKTMKKVGLDCGPLTESAISQFSDAFDAVFTDLPIMTGADGGDDATFFLTSGLDVEKLPENLN